MLSNFKMEKFQVFRQETCGYFHQMNYMIINWKLISNTNITSFLMLQCYKTFIWTVIHTFIFHNRWEIQEIPHMYEDAFLLTALKEVMGGEISEKTQEDIDKPTIPPSPMIDQGMGS